MFQLILNIFSYADHFFFGETEEAEQGRGLCRHIPGSVTKRVISSWAHLQQGISLRAACERVKSKPFSLWNFIFIREENRKEKKKGKEKRIRRWKRNFNLMPK